MRDIVHWRGEIRRQFYDVNSTEVEIPTVDLLLTTDGLKINQLDMKDQIYMFTMCKKAVDAWIINNPGDPDHAVKIVNDTLNRYRDQIEKTTRDQFVLSIEDYR